MTTVAGDVDFEHIHIHRRKLQQFFWRAAMSIPDFDEEPSVARGNSNDVGDDVARRDLETDVSQDNGLCGRHLAALAFHVDYPRFRQRDPAMSRDDLFPEDVQRRFSGGCAIWRDLVGTMGERMSAQACMTAVPGDQDAPATEADASASQPVRHLRYVAGYPIESVACDEDGAVIARKKVGERYTGRHQCP